MWQLLFVFLLFAHANALNDAEGKELFMKHTLKCSKDHPVDLMDLQQLQILKVPNKPEVKCLLACTYRILGTLDKNGMFDQQKSYEYAELMKDGDEKRLENGKKLADMCLKVNEKPVSDGEKGCERSALMFQCIAEHAPKLGFKLM